MNLPIVIFLGGLATYAMRCAALWLRGDWSQAAWLDELPLAVLLSLTTLSLAGLCTGSQETLAAGLSSAAIIASRRMQLPLIASLALGCLLYGLLVP